MMTNKIKRENGGFFFLLLIRIVYVVTTIKILDGLWYYGGGYDINFNLQKEIFALCMFAAMTFYFKYNYYANNFKSIVIKVLLHYITYHLMRRFRFMIKQCCILR